MELLQLSIFNSQFQYCLVPPKASNTAIYQTVNMTRIKTNVEADFFMP